MSSTIRNYKVEVYQKQEEAPKEKSCGQKTLDKIKNAFNKVVSFAKMKPIIFSLICLCIIAVIVIVIVVPIVVTKKKKSNNEDETCSDNNYSDKCLYERMIAKKTDYPEGMPWTNDNTYAWKGGIYNSGAGCAGFAFMLSDACFGNIQANQLEPCPTEYKVGDVVRINNDTHYIIILKIDLSTNTITIAEGNFNKSIHWGRTFTVEGLQDTCNHILRRNPN